MATESTASPLLELPAELRIRIYEYAICIEEPYEITKAEGVPEPALLLVNHQIRKEAMSIFYMANTFAVDLVAFDPAPDQLWARKRRLLACKYDIVLPHRQSSVGFDRSVSWNNLKRWLRVHHDGGSFIRRRGAEQYGIQTLDQQLTVVVGLVGMVQRMTSIQWRSVEPILESLRVGLIALDAQWGDDSL